MIHSSCSKAPDTVSELEAAVEEAIEACDGDARAAVRALIIAARFHDAEMDALRAEIAEVVAAVSHGFTRGRYGPTE